MLGNAHRGPTPLSSECLVVYFDEARSKTSDFCAFDGQTVFARFTGSDEFDADR